MIHRALFKFRKTGFLADVAESESYAPWPLALPSSCKINAFVQQRSLHQCQHPLDLWLLIALLHFICFGLAFALGRRAEKGANWWFVEPQSRIAVWAFRYTWAALLPMLSAWTILGVHWLSDTLHHTPECFSADGYFTPALCVLSQVICGFASALYLVLVINVWDVQKCRRANLAAIQMVSDEDLVERWGRLKPAPTMQFCGGLLPTEFGTLPRHSIDEGGQQCVICLEMLLAGDSARSLPGCGHVFHRACVDLWLLRQKICPLCKADVRVSET